MSSSGASPNRPLPVTFLKEEVICTTCLSLPRVSMYQCENGHLICRDCMSKCSSTCPTCKKPLGKIRSIIADKIISLMPLPCRHADLGCQEELYRDALLLHEDSCQFRPVSCVDIACHAKVSFCKMLDHMARDHESGDFVHANGNEYKSYFIVQEDDFFKKVMWLSDHLTLDGKHFFRECCRSPEGQWHVWVYILGSKEDALKYKASIKIVLPSTGEEFVYRGKVNALTSPVHPDPEVLASLTFPDFVARRFLHDEKIHYEVEVHKTSLRKTKAAPPASALQERTETAAKREESASSAPSLPPEALVASNQDPPEVEEPATCESKSADERARRKAEKKLRKTKSAKDSSTAPSKEDVKETSC